MNKRIFNEQKTQEVFNPDFLLGYLRDDKLLIRTEQAQVAVQEQGYYETVQEYPNGGKEVKWVVTVPGVQARDAENIYEEIQEYVLLTAEQLEQQKKVRRSYYMDAYRKYQAAVNYGEFERVVLVDSFVERLRNKDWSAFLSIPPQIKYFAGEVGFAESGLTRR